MKIHIHNIWLVGVPLGMSALISGVLAQACTGNLCIPSENLILLQPLGSNGSLAPQPGIGIFFVYFNDVWPWVLGVAAGIAVLQALVGGVQMMMAGSSEKAAEGKTRLLWALGGILLIAFSGFFLRALNNLFFL